MNPWLLAGGIASAVAALVHLLCIPGGATWYRMMGAGERMSRAVARGEVRPHLITLAVAGMLATWSAYALAGAGLGPGLPLLRPVLVAITAVYLARAAALPVMVRAMPDRSRHFLVASSAVVLAIGTVHAIGLVTAWPRL